MSTCKLSLVGSLLENQNSSATLHLPKTIVIHDDPDEIVTIGRENSKSKVNYVLGDSSKPRVVSLLHATLRYNREDCSFSLTDQSVNGTYVNNVRVPLGGVKLETGDIVCFFHRHGANIKPGEEVEQRDIHLKYRVEFVDDNYEEEEIDDGDNRANDSRYFMKEKTIFEAHPVVNRYKRHPLTEMNVNAIEESDREFARGRQVMKERLTIMSREEKSDGCDQRENRVKGVGRAENGDSSEEECTESEVVKKRKKNQPLKRLRYWSKDVVGGICAGTDCADDKDDDDSDEEENNGDAVPGLNWPVHGRPAVADTTEGRDVKRARMEDQRQREGHQGAAGTTGGTVAQPSRMEDSQWSAGGTVSEDGCTESEEVKKRKKNQPFKRLCYWSKDVVGGICVGVDGADDEDDDDVEVDKDAAAADEGHQGAAGGTVSDSEDRDDDENSDGAKTPPMIQHNNKCLEERAYLTEVPEVRKKLCASCFNRIGKWGAYGFEQCLRAKGHIYCLACFAKTVVETYRGLAVPRDVQCEVCMLRSTNIWVRDRLCALAGHLPAIMDYSKTKEKAKGLYNSAVGRRWFEPSTVEQEDAAERWRMMARRMEITMDLPEDTCLGCLGDLSAALFHRGYSLCCAAHKFCVECAIRHKRCHLTAYHPRNSPVVVRDMIVYEVNDEHLEAVKILFNAGEPLEALHDHAALVEASRRSWDYGQPPPT